MGFFKIILSLVYLLVYLKSLVGLLVGKIHNFLAVSSDSALNSDKIRSQVKAKNVKLPRHISFVLQEPEIRYHDVAKLVVWSMAVGISYISIYDRKGMVLTIAKSATQKVLVHNERAWTIVHYPSDLTFLDILRFFFFAGVLKKNAAFLSSELIRKKNEIFIDESSKHTFVLRTKDTKFDCNLGKFYDIASVLLHCVARKASCWGTLARSCYNLQSTYTNHRKNSLISRSINIALR